MTGASINPLIDRYSLEGKVVTMDADFKVLERGIVDIEAAKIVAVRPTGSPPPEGFEGTTLIRTGGTIYPGLIELHNHLSYNILPMWDVPKQFRRREQWRSHPDKQKLITGPMKVLGKTPGYVEAIVRYVECKCLVSGVTTSQGLKLYGVGVQPYYRGLIRNVEDTDDPALPEANTRIADVEAEDAAKFLARLEDPGTSCLLLHLSEGVDDRAREHFRALQLPSGAWAITDTLAGIHCAALGEEDFQVMAGHGGHMIWSPLSNLLLYGQTADIKQAKESGVLIGIGSDWSPSGSKNLLCELKVAHLVSKSASGAPEGVFTAREIVAMATRDAAKILKWDQAIGSIESGKLADFLVVWGRQGDPYLRLIEKVRESSITLVVIGGVPRYGQKRLMDRFAVDQEKVAVGETERFLNLKEEQANPIVGTMTLGEATDRLKEGLGKLAELAHALEDPNNAIARLAASGKTFKEPDLAITELVGMGLAGGDLAGAAAEAGLDISERPLVFLELDQDELEGETLRPHLPSAETGEPTGFPEPPTAAVVYSELLKDVTVELDAITIAGDEGYFDRIARQPNLPDSLRAELPPLYGEKPRLPEDGEFLERVHPSVRTHFASTVELPTFLRMGGFLTLEDRKRLIEQALVLMEMIYVHLPLKRAMHAIDPVQRLRLLQHQMEQMNEDEIPPEVEFHKEMTSIFTSTRDLHTNYLLPNPFQKKTAFLTFLIEEYFEDGEPRYMVSKIIKVIGDDGSEVIPETFPETFKEGVEVLYWNGIPIRRAVELNADRQAGSNLAARHARGLDTLTIRPMIRVLPPEEEWVTLRYRTKNGEENEWTQPWLVFSPGTARGVVDPDSSDIEEATALGYDLQTDAVHQAKKVLFAPRAVEAERTIAETRKRQAAPPQGVRTAMPTVFRAKPVPTGHGRFGYIRIFTFNVPDADAFVNEFVRLAQSLPKRGLIVDVRGNGGGLIYAAERLLQILTPRWVEPERAQFINTPLTLEICKRHAPSPLWADFDLKPWIESIDQSIESGATYSRGFPITLEESCNTIGQKYFGPVVLITDALCYSATDIFAAGFQDHGTGLILGTSENTGAGGANVWTHRMLQILMNDPADPLTPRPGSAFRPLPHGAGMRAAVRRTMRVGKRSGVPVEDFGVKPKPENIHRMTKRDLLDGNKDLIEKAAEILAGCPAYTLEVVVEGIQRNRLRASIKTKNLTRLDLFLDGRPEGSLNVSDETRQVDVRLPSRRDRQAALILELKGYAGEDLVASSRIEIIGD